jgi:hypothetical protein
MKRTVITLFGILFGIVFANGQTLVTTHPINKNVVLEGYTGIHCQYCPDGDRVARSVQDNNPGRIAVIDVHQGGYASPSAGEPDYRTPFGDPLAAQTGLGAIGYPSGTVNRHVFIGGRTAMDRSNWANTSALILGQVSPVNLGVTSDFDSITRLLTVHVELYYTANSATTTNYINVALIQDHVFGPQTGGGAGNHYEHMNMLRYLVTGQWGDTVTTTTTGSLVERTYTFTVPASYNSVPCVVPDCRVVAFVAQSHQEILTGDVVNAIGGTNLYIGDINTSDSTMVMGNPAVTHVFNLQAISNLPGTGSFILKITGNAPADWNAHLRIGGTDYPDSAVVDLVMGTPKNVELDVTPGDSSGFYTYTLTLSSVNNPDAPVKYFKVCVISNVNTLLINASGDDNSKNHQGVYLNGLAAGGSTRNAVMGSDVFVKASASNILTQVKNIFYNVAWTFPAFTDPEALALKAFLNTGRNLFVAGQDIGWDIMSGGAGSHGTPEAQDLYTNYLEAQWIDDGTTANNKLIARTSDTIFGTVATSNVVDVNGGNMYPDQIAPLSDAVPIFYYDAALTKVGAIRTIKGGSRIVYFGVGLEMVQTVDIANDIIGRTWQWFMGSTSGIDEPSLKGESLGQSIPNPCTSYTSIPFSLNSSGQVSLDLYDVNGKVVQRLLREFFRAGNHQVKVSTSPLDAGVYYYTLRTSSGNLTRKMIVVK